MDKESIKVEPFGSTSIISPRNIFISFLISIIFHIIVLIFIILFRSNNSHMENLEFIFFFFSDVALWSLCLIPLIATFRGMLQWNDPYFIFSVFIFGSIMTIYLAYVIDPHYTYLRTNWGSIAFSDFTESVLLWRLVESEFVIFIFVSTILYINRYIPKHVSQSIVKPIQLIPATLTGILCLVLGVVGYVVVWSSKSFFDALVFSMGSPELAPTPGMGKFFAFQKWAIITLPIVILSFIYALPRRRFFSFIVNFFFVLLILGSILPIMIFGARLMVVYTVYATIVVLYRFGIRLHKLHIFFLVVAILLYVFFITLVRGNPNLSGEAINVIYSLYIDPLSIKKADGEIISYLFHLDRVAIVASILHHLHATGEYLYGRSLISGPYNLVIYFINKLSQSNFNEIITSTDYVCIWRFGLIPYWGKGPPSLPGEFFMQFGYWGLFPLSIIFGYFFSWLRKKQLYSNSVMKYCLFTMISVELMNSVGAEFGLIFKFLFLHIVPITTIYTIIYFIIYGWHSKYSKFISENLKR